MSIDKNISDAFQIDHTPVVYEKKLPETLPILEDTNGDDKDADYSLVRETLRNLITKGNDAIDEISEIARQNESSRGYEVMANLIKTVGETSKDLYNLQKVRRELKEPDGNKKLDETNINVEKAVFVGSTADLLRTLKEPKLIEGREE